MSRFRLLYRAPVCAGTALRELLLSRPSSSLHQVAAAPELPISLPVHQVAALEAPSSSVQQVAALEAPSSSAKQSAASVAQLIM